MFTGLASMQDYMRFPKVEPWNLGILMVNLGKPGPIPRLNLVGSQVKARDK
jgi:hypothetical protein